MTYRAVFIETEEGVAVFTPAMPGCVSQGTSRIDALENIREAMTLWLDSGGIPLEDGGAERELDLLQEAAADFLQHSVCDVSLAMDA